VITTVHGRHEHLRRQMAGLRRSSWSADMHVVVALADPMIRGVVAETNSPAVVADCDYANGQLPVAQGRNIGATAALRGGAELLVFLDVDCIPGAALIGRYHRAATWEHIGGFCELYRGYGGEATDFAQCAAAGGVTMRWVGGADAFHQYHPVSNPPIEHLDDILCNAAVFHRRWGWWPMEGWLHEFQNRGLIARDGDGRPHRLGAAP
jgi:hypothetical protein